MNFIETLKSVGGVKPCEAHEKGWAHSLHCPGYVGAKPCPSVTCVNGRQPGEVFSKETGEKVSDGSICRDCHGTGSIIDLAPLLARPPLLEHFVYLLCTEANKAGMNLGQMVGEMPRSFRECRYDVSAEKTGHLYVIGPQRAHSLVYEIARQLGGTAVVAIEDFKWEVVDIIDSGYDDIVQQINHRGEMYRIGRKKRGYRLSLHIPPDATVLFVTDRMDEKEMMEIMQETSSQPANALPYVLALVSSSDVWMNDPEGDKTNTWKIISLHGV